MYYGVREIEIVDNGFGKELIKREIELFKTLNEAKENLKLALQDLENDLSLGELTYKKVGDGFLIYDGERVHYVGYEIVLISKEDAEKYNREYFKKYTYLKEDEISRKIDNLINKNLKNSI